LLLQGIDENGQGEQAMRRAMLMMAAAAGFGLAAMAPAHAVGSRYPFCLQGNDSPGLSNCTFTSYQQCQATASGIASPIRSMAAAPSRGSTASADRRRAIPIRAIEP
jgi:hypothetical protein